MNKSFTVGFIKKAFEVEHLKGLTPKHQKRYIELLRRVLKKKRGS
jgi:hypothetical protein